MYFLFIDLVGSDIGRIAETGKIVVSVMQTIIVEKKISQQDVYLILQSLACVLQQFLKDLQSFESDKDTLGF